MRLDKVTYWAERIVFPLNRVVHKAALAVLILLMFLTVGDVIGRYLVGRLPFFQPIPGTFELTEFMLVLIVFAAIGYTQVRGEHISIDVLISRFSPRTQGVIDTVTYLVSLAIFSLVTWQSIVYSRTLFREQDVSGVLLLPVYPFLIAVGVGSFIFCLALLVSLLHSLNKAVKHEP